MRKSKRATRLLTALSAVLALVAGLLATTALSAAAQDSPLASIVAARHLSPAATETTIVHDLNRADIALLRNGAVAPVAYNITVGTPTRPQHVGAGFIFGRTVGFLLEERGTPARVEYNQYVNQGAQLVAFWDGTAVYRFRGTGWTYFLYDHHRGVNALLVLQGRTAFYTYCMLWDLVIKADLGILP